MGQKGQDKCQQRQAKRHIHAMWSRREDYVPDCRAGDKYEHRDDWMPPGQALHDRQYADHEHREPRQAGEDSAVDPRAEEMAVAGQAARSEEHTSELQSLMRISYSVFCLKKKKYTHIHKTN